MYSVLQYMFNMIDTKAFKTVTLSFFLKFCPNVDFM